MVLNGNKWYLMVLEYYYKKNAKNHAKSDKLFQNQTFCILHVKLFQAKPKPPCMITHLVLTKHGM